MSENQPLRPLPIPLHALRDYGIDASGQVWRMSASARSSGGKTIDKPLFGSTLLDLSNVLGKSHSNRDKAPHLLMRGIWQLRPFHEANAEGWKGNIHDYLREQSTEIPDQACWFQISLPTAGLTKATLQLLQAHDHQLKDSRNHCPYIIMGKIAFEALLDRND
jgi:hypothetical protein